MYTTDAAPSRLEHPPPVQARLPSPPINNWIQSLYGPPNPDTTPLADLRHRFPSLAKVTSFAEIISISSKYLKANAIKKAGDHAASFFASNPRINLATIQQDTVDAQSSDFLGFLTKRSEHLRTVTVQDCDALQPDLEPDMISWPPRPPQHTLQQFHTLHEGASLIIPPGFIPDGCPMPPPKPPAYALAVEYLHRKDYLAGLSIVLPHDVATVTVPHPYS